LIMSMVVSGAMMACTFGAAPAAFIPTPHMVSAAGMPAGNISDFVPMTNIPTFGMCMSIANPEVASATAAALGVLTPMPCVPMTSAPWIPGCPNVMVGGMPALTNECTCICDWAGEISITFAGQVAVTAT
jgi:hypothetical protein